MTAVPPFGSEIPPRGPLDDQPALDGPAPPPELVLCSTLLLDHPEVSERLAGAGELARGARGPAVAAVQEALVQLGAGLSADGVYGRRTETATAAFQRRIGLTPTGRVDRATVEALDDALVEAERYADGHAAAGSDGAATGTPAADSALAVDPLDPAPSSAGSADGTVLSGSSPAVAVPGPYDTGCFVDADELPAVPGLRRYLDRALTTGDHDAVRALRRVDLNLASTEERVRLVAHLLDGRT